MNFIDELGDNIRNLFLLDEEKIQAIVNAFNKYGGNISQKKIGELIGISSDDPKTSSIRRTLSELVHHYVHHKDNFEKDLSESKLDKQLIDKTKKLLENFNEKGLNGLSILFAASRTFRDKPALLRFRFDSMLQTYTDDDGKIIGHLPLARLVFNIRDENNTKKNQIIYITLEGFESFIEALTDTKEEFKAVAREYRNKMGEYVIAPGDQ